jgi:osmotically-inducible protein OsmY
LDPIVRSRSLATQVSVETAVLDALHTDPRIPHPEEVAVAVDEDTVTLRGTVGSFTQRRAAVRNARQVDGVRYVHDDLSVRLLDAAQRSDAELRGMALQAIARDTEAPAELIDVKVEDGWVTLRGGPQPLTARELCQSNRERNSKCPTRCPPKTT